MRASKPVEIALRPSLEEFTTRYFRPGRPVVIKGALEGWRALEAWTPEYLKAQIGDVKAPLFRNVGQTYGLSPDTLGRRKDEVRVGDYIDTIFGAREPSEYYLNGLPIRKFPAIAGDVTTPEYTRNVTDDGFNLWLAAAGQKTLLHYDFAPNFIAMVRGKKRFVMFAPADRWNLYPWPALRHHWLVAHHSRVDIDQPDTAKFPRMERAQPYEVTLERGDLLFVPPYWWHQVYTLEPGANVNMWWRDKSLRQTLDPSNLRIVLSRLFHPDPKRR